MLDTLTLINGNYDKIPSFNGVTGVKRLIKAGRLYGDVDKFTPHQRACLWVIVNSKGYNLLNDFLNTKPLVKIDNALIISNGVKHSEGFEGVEMQRVSYHTHYKIDITTHGCPIDNSGVINITKQKLRYIDKPTYDQIRLDYILGNYEENVLSVEEK